MSKGALDAAAPEVAVRLCAREGASWQAKVRKRLPAQRRRARAPRRTRPRAGARVRAVGGRSDAGWGLDRTRATSPSADSFCARAASRALATPKEGGVSVAATAPALLAGYYGDEHKHRLVVDFEDHLEDVSKDWLANGEAVCGA